MKTEKCECNVGTKPDPKKARRAEDCEWEPIPSQAYESCGTDDEADDSEAMRLKVEKQPAGSTVKDV